jgi:hypothetical protein
MLGLPGMFIQTRTNRQSRSVDYSNEESRKTFGESASETNKVTIGKDGKTILIVDEKGWKYTLTLRLVK